MTACRILVFLLFLLACPAQAAFASVPFGDAVSEESARTIAQAALDDAACREGAAALADLPSALFAARSPARRLALAAALRGADATACGEQKLARVRELLARPYLPDLLDFYEFLTARRAALLAEAVPLVEKAGAAITARGYVDTELPRNPRVLALAGQLEALALFDACLPLFGGLWAEPERVVAAMERAVELDDETYFFWMALGEALFQTGKKRGAVAALDRAVALAPGAARPRHSRGLVHFAMNSLALAELDMSAALRFNPENPEYWQSRGTLRGDLGDRPGMCADFTQACRLGLCGPYEASARFCRDASLDVIFRSGHVP